MDLVSLIYLLLLGLAAGWIAGQLTQGHSFGLVGNLIVGVVGALLGGFVCGLLGFVASGLLAKLISAVIGAVLLLYALTYIKK